MSILYSIIDAEKDIIANDSIPDNNSLTDHAWCEYSRSIKVKVKCSTRRYSRSWLRRGIAYEMQQVARFFHFTTHIWSNSFLSNGSITSKSSSTMNKINSALLCSLFCVSLTPYTYFKVTSVSKNLKITTEQYVGIFFQFCPITRIINYSQKLISIS